MEKKGKRNYWKRSWLWKREATFICAWREAGKYVRNCPRAKVESFVFLPSLEIWEVRHPLLPDIPCCCRSCSDLYLPRKEMLQFPGPWGWGLSFVLYDCTSHRSNAGLLILHSSASLKLGSFSHFSGMALRILMSLKTTSSQETHCFAGLTLIMLHFSNLISFCCRPALWALWSTSSEVWVWKSWFCSKASCVTKGNSLCPTSLSVLLYQNGGNWV